MISLALIGKNIQHSLSPHLYRKLLEKEIEYTFYDILDIKEINLKDILSIHRGVSVTSPYKGSFLKNIEGDSLLKELGACNCMRLNSNRIEGTNTDYDALLFQLKIFREEFPNIQFIILGDGVMSSLTVYAMKALNLSFEVLSRKKKSLTASSDLRIFSRNFKIIFINTCSREFIFQGRISQKSIFWDYNYNLKEHSEALSLKCDYRDGRSMLQRQASYSIKYWNLQ